MALEWHLSCNNTKINEYNHNKSSTIAKVARRFLVVVFVIVWLLATMYTNLLVEDEAVIDDLITSNYLRHHSVRLRPLYRTLDLSRDYPVLVSSLHGS